MIPAIVVDDERPSRDALCTYLRDYCPRVEIVATCNSIKSAYQAILKQHPELVFLDIEMPNGNGFDLLRMFSPLEFKVIFITAYSDYAIKAFRYCATDYLLKPVKVDELIEAVTRVENERDHGKNNYPVETLLDTITRPEEVFDRLVIPDTKGFTVIKLPDIIMCMADGYCTHFYLTEKRKITSSKNLKYYEMLMENHHFIRTHNSYLINLDHVSGFANQGEIYLNEGCTCPLGNSYKSNFLARFKRLK